jgi:hypothetical protein
MILIILASFYYVSAYLQTHLVSDDRVNATLRKAQDT